MKRLLVVLKFFSIELGQDYFMIFNYKAAPDKIEKFMKRIDSALIYKSR